MSKPAIHQFVAGYSRGDAISNEARVLRKIFRSWGYASEIFCDRDNILPELKSDCFNVLEYEGKSRGGDILFNHLSIGCTANDIFARASAKKILLYHNITPSEYFNFINAEIGSQLTWGRDQAKALAGVAEINLADSRYNALELEAWGYGPVGVLPLVLELSLLDIPPVKGILKKYRDGEKNILFVGRCAPNKAIEDLLHAFYYYQKFVEPNSRLIHVGSSSGVEEYQIIMRMKSIDLNLKNVLFAGSVSQAHLNAFYKVSHLFLCMSEHEGFGIPLIESMYQHIPVLAYEKTAVPDTMEGAGVLFKEKKFDEIAEMMAQIINNQPFRDTILNGQKERIARYQNRNLDQELRAHLKPVLEEN